MGKINAVLIEITPEHNTKTLNYVLIVGWQIFFNFFLIYKFQNLQQNKPSRCCKCKKEAYRKYASSIKIYRIISY